MGQMALGIGRREFIAALGSAVFQWPLAARAQQPAIPIVGMLSGVSASAGNALAAVQAGLKESGFVEGQNVAFEYRFANGHYDQLPALAADLVDRHVTVIATIGENATIAAKIASAGRIPIVFAMGDDPVALGVVTSMNRPDGNITGSTSIGHSLGPKRVELLHELLPASRVVALLSNPEQASKFERKNIEEKVEAIGLRVRYLAASSVAEFETAFTTLVSEQIDGLIIANETYYFSEIRTLASFASRYRVPTIGPLRAFADSGGLMSYGANIPDVARQTGIYVGRVLKGDKPSDLPVVQPSRFEFVINLKAAKALGLTVPQSLQVAADEVIE
jgi:putative ABC transport system substrate-binding protein